MSKFKRDKNQRPKSKVDLTPALDERPYEECFYLPEELILSNGEMITNSEIVSLKIKGKYGLSLSLEEKETLDIVLKKVEELREKYIKEKE